MVVRLVKRGFLVPVVRGREGGREGGREEGKRGDRWVDFVCRVLSYIHVFPSFPASFPPSLSFSQGTPTRKSRRRRRRKGGREGGRGLLAPLCFETPVCGCFIMEGGGGG